MRIGFIVGVIKLPTPIIHGIKKRATSLYPRIEVNKMDPEFVKIFLSLLVLVNPITAIPIFVSLTTDNNHMERRKIASVACITIWVSVICFTLFGDGLLKALNITVGAFQVGGGILVFLIAIAMMNAKPLTTKTTEAEKHEAVNSKESIAVVPLAIPLLMGPGCISTIIIYSASATSFMKYLEIIIAGAIVSLICYLCMMFSEKLTSILGKTGINVINRIMGMILAALSIEIISAGLKSIFPILTTHI